MLNTYFAIYNETTPMRTWETRPRLRCSEETNPFGRASLTV